jgi:hypothetical protein
MGTGQAILHCLPIRLVSLLVLGLVGGCGGRTPAQVFEAVLKSPAPRSVVIIKSDEAAGLSRCSWVHFRATPADIASLLRAHPFGVQANPPDDFSALSPPPWWNPVLLGRGRTAYRWDHRVDDDVTETHIVFHNAAKDELFAVFFSNW